LGETVISKKGGAVKTKWKKKKKRGGKGLMKGKGTDGEGHY